MSGPCLCGDPACYRCFGERAKYAGWCDDCPYFEDEDTGTECTAAPGDEGCRRKDADDDARVENALAQREED